MDQVSPTLPEILAEHPDMLPAVRSAIKEMVAKAKVAPAEKRASINSAADHLRLAIAKSQLITVKGGKTDA